MTYPLPNEEDLTVEPLSPLTTKKNKRIAELEALVYKLQVLSLSQAVQLKDLEEENARLRGSRSHPLPTLDIASNKW